MLILKNIFFFSESNALVFEWKLILSRNLKQVRQSAFPSAYMVIYWKQAISPLRGIKTFYFKNRIGQELKYSVNICPKVALSWNPMI